MVAALNSFRKALGAHQWRCPRDLENSTSTSDGPVVPLVSKTFGIPVYSFGSDSFQPSLSSTPGFVLGIWGI